MTIRVTFIPAEISANGTSAVRHRSAFLHREGEEPRLIMRNIQMRSGETLGHRESHWIYGDVVEGFDFTQLEDNDRIVYMMDRKSSHNGSMLIENVHQAEDVLSYFDKADSLSSVARGLTTRPGLIVSTTEEMYQNVEKGARLATIVSAIYKQFEMFTNIMMKENDEVVSYDLLSLIDKQDDELRQELETYLLTIDRHNLNTPQTNTVLQKVLSNIPFDENFSLLTEEEQVGHFIEFSKLSSKTKTEYVPDKMIEAIKDSHEYQTSLEDIREAGLGESATQQFNALQQIGYFSKSRHRKDILYNLSDMGAGKTLMTVQAINVLDKKQVSAWVDSDDFERYPNVMFSVPDKHIITPTLSVRSSWIETFEMFYDVEEVSETCYRLTMEYRGFTVESYAYVAPFTIRNGLVYVSDKLPVAAHNTYLIVDEVHQLVQKAMPKTKFFPPKTEPVMTYKTFILSGTMSNLLTSEWLNFIRFMGLPVSGETHQEAKKQAERTHDKIADSISTGIDEINSVHRRTIDKDEFHDGDIADVQPKKMTSQDMYFYTMYGSLIAAPPRFLTPDFVDDGNAEKESMSYAEYLEDIGKHRSGLYANPEESDTTNFELFYQLVGPQSVTAESSVVAEELFGEEQKQHTSDIIKAQSPLNNEDIEILKTLHHISEDYNKYKSLRVAKQINTAILNLNDGLQTKNVYDILSHAAEKNARFFEYLSKLDLNILEKLPQSNLIDMPKLEDTEKFGILQDILKREEDETHLIVVNDFHALKTLSKALGIDHVTKKQLKRELSYQDTLDELFAKQSVVVVTQDMIKSSLDLVQANRLVQYQLNTEISDIIQTQNRINRIGQTRETRGYYIASDALQENLIELFLESYQNIRVAHKGIVELFVDVTSQINIVNNYLAKAFDVLDDADMEAETVLHETETMTENVTYEHIVNVKQPDSQVRIASENGISKAILMPGENYTAVIVPLDDASNTPFELGELNLNVTITEPTIARINIDTLEVSFHEGQQTAV